MATGASNADLAILLIDARKGLLTQTRRHSMIVSLLGIRHVVLAVNKIDLVDFDEGVFREIVAAFREFAEPLSFRSVVAIPMSARFGDNVSARSERTPWYEGPTLLEHLEICDVEEDRGTAPFRLPVQWVNRPNLDFRGYAGTIASGKLRRGDPIVVAASGRTSTVASLYRADELVEEAAAGDAVTVTLADEVDIARGDVLARPEARPEVADQFTAHVIWMSAEPMLPGRSYFLKNGARTTPASITELKHRIDVNSREKLAAKTLALNEIGFCNLATTLPIAFDPYSDNRETGAFILIDRRTNETAAAGVIAHGLRRATNVHRHGFTITREGHAALKHQKPAVLWFTGLSGAGKSTIANLVEQRLFSRGVHTALAGWRQRSPRPQQGPRLHRRRPRREHPPRRGGRAADDGRGPDRAHVVHLAVPGRATARARHRGRRRIHRDFRRHAAGGRDRARSQGPLQARPEGRDQEFHRHRPALRGARKPRTHA